MNNERVCRTAPATRGLFNTTLPLCKEEEKNTNLHYTILDFDHNMENKFNSSSIVSNREKQTLSTHNLYQSFKYSFDLAAKPQKPHFTNG